MPLRPALARLLPVALAAAALLLSAAGCEHTYKKLDSMDNALAQSEAPKRQQMLLREYLDKSRHINRVAWPVLVANAPLCRSRSPRLGLWATSVEDLPFSQRAAFAELFGADSRLMAVDVFPGGPADKAGIKPRDVILAVNGDPVRTGFDATNLFHRLLEKHLVKGPDMEFTIEREGQTQTLHATAVQACGENVYLDGDSDPNAFANGVDIFVTIGLIHFLNDDDELAGVIGHEMAHNEMGHKNAKLANIKLASQLVQAPAMILGAYFGSRLHSMVVRNAGQAYSIDFEYEADYVGLYYAARAGYDVSKVPTTERRFAALDPKMITIGSSHPPSAPRFVAMEAALHEIQAKQAAGQPLEPNMKHE